MVTPENADYDPFALDDETRRRVETIDDRLDHLQALVDSLEEERAELLKQQ